MADTDRATPSPVRCHTTAGDYARVIREEVIAVTVHTLERPLYEVREAAAVLRMPASTLRWWLEGRDEYPPVLRPEPTGSNEVTWGELVEASLLRQYRVTHGVSLSYLRSVINALRTRLELRYPLAHERPYIAPGKQLVVAAQAEADSRAQLPLVYEVVGGQLVLSAPVEAFLRRVDFSDDAARWAIRLRPDGPESPVVIDPELSFGTPTVNGVRTAVLAELIDAGEPLDEVAEGFDLSPVELRAALAYEYEPAAA